jgi:SAM-dependent methyltransferase
MKASNMHQTAEARIARQLGQYRFPYHWLPMLSDRGVVAGRSMQWALEYCGYMSVVADEIKSAGARSVLDVGCGDGRLGSFLHEAAQINYVGVDISEEAISFAQGLNPTGHYRCVPLAEVSEKFDLAAAVEVIEHIPDDILHGFLCDIRCALKPNGVFIVSVPSTVRKVHPKHFRHYNEGLLESQLVDAGFSMMKMYRVHRDSRFARLLQVMLTNRFFSLNASFLTRWIWQAYKRYCIWATPRDGAHILAIASVRSV